MLLKASLTMIWYMCMFLFLYNDKLGQLLKLCGLLHDNFGHLITRKFGHPSSGSVL